MSKKHNTIATPESRHLVAAEKEFADGWVKYALWNTVIDGPDEVSEANKSRYLQLRAERLAIEEGVVSRNRRKFRQPINVAYLALGRCVPTSPA